MWTRTASVWGVWISNLRAARKARPESFQVTPEHIALLDAIGMQWDAREAKWAGAFRRAEEYRAAHGDLLVPVNYKTEDGFCLATGSAGCAKTMPVPRKS